MFRNPLFGHHFKQSAQHLGRFSSAGEGLRSKAAVQAAGNNAPASQVVDNLPGPVVISYISRIVSRVGYQLVSGSVFVINNGKAREMAIGEGEKLKGVSVMDPKPLENNQMAERKGFEPLRQCYPPTRFPIERLQPNSATSPDKNIKLSSWRVRRFQVKDYIGLCPLHKRFAHSPALPCDLPIRGSLLISHLSGYKY